MEGTKARRRTAAFGGRQNQPAVSFFLCSVAQGGCPPRAPTDPDVQDYRIRLLRDRSSLRDTPSAGSTVGSGDNAGAAG